MRLPHYVRAPFIRCGVKWIRWEAHPILFGFEHAWVELGEVEKTQLNHNHNMGKNQTNPTQ